MTLHEDVGRDETHSLRSAMVTLTWAFGRKGQSITALRGAQAQPYRLSCDGVMSWHFEALRCSTNDTRRSSAGFNLGGVMQKNGAFIRNVPYSSLSSARDLLAAVALNHSLFLASHCLFQLPPPNSSKALPKTLSSLSFPCLDILRSFSLRHD